MPQLPKAIFKKIFYSLVFLPFILCGVLEKGFAQGTYTIENYMGDFFAEVGTSSSQTYYISGGGFAPNTVLTIAVGDPSGSFTVSDTPGDPTTFSAQIEIMADDFGGFDLPVGVKYSPANEGPHTATITHSVDGSSTKSFTVYGNPEPMPVSLLSFTARETNEVIVLDWVTASEIKSSYFDIELMRRSESGFEKIGRVKSKQKNSYQTSNYTFEHPGKGIAGQYFFRLKQVDSDGNFAYSKIVSVVTTETTIKIGPNPINASSQLSFTAPEAGKLNIKILNRDGRAIYTSSYNIKGRGKSDIKLHLDSEVAAGVYILISEFKGNFNRVKLIKGS